MTSRFGPIRLIALQCGKFDYAEVELDRPLHLVGPNNVGKTSLIALLQFLYLDEQKSMRFARELPETRRYYFPSVYSYALFECLTPTGYQTVGIRGCGPVRQYEFERFTWQGKVEPELFLTTEGRVREPDEIRADLAPRGYTLLTPAALRAALTGVGDSQKVHLGLVPARNRDTYASFRTLFCNILRLSHIRQEEMKSLLLALFAKRFHQQGEIDLARTYGENFEKVKRDAQAIQTLIQLVPDIERALRHQVRRDAARGRLPVLFQGIRAAAQAETTRLREARASLAGRREKLAEVLEQTERDGAEAQAALTEQTRQLTRLDDWLTETAALEKELEGYLCDWNTQRLTEVERLSDELARRLGNLRAEPLAQVEARLARHESALDALRQRLATVEHAVVQTLRRRFRDDELETLFRLLNPEWLGLPLNRPEPGVAVDDARQVEAALRALLQATGEGTFRGPGLTLDLAALQPPLLDAFGDADRIRDEMAMLERQIDNDRQLCRDAREAEQLRHQKQAFEQERRELLKRQEQFAALQARREQHAAMTNRHRAAADAQAALQSRIQALNSRVQEIHGERQALSGEAERLELGEQRIVQLLSGVTQPPAEWAAEASDPVSGDIEDLVARYRKDQIDQQRQDEALNEILESIHGRTYASYSGADERETLQRLAEARDALPGREQATAELWKGIAVGIRENLQDLGTDLETLRARTSGINRGLARIGISNLKGLRLVIVDNPQWTRRIRSIRLQDDMPLFAGAGEADQALAEIGRLLSERPRIALGDLFQLEFEIELPDGTVRKYPHLDRIESNGTTIAIKVLVNLALLQNLLEGAEVSIPFYLDECSSLDSGNLNAIVATAREMGFVAVLASPEALDAAGRLYYIRERSDGRVVLDPRQALVECLDGDGGKPDGAGDA